VIDLAKKDNVQLKMIKLIKSTLHREKESKQALIRFINTAEQLSFGPQCRKFEKKFAQYQARKDAVFLNSGSSANLALIQSLMNLGRLRRGDAVGFSAVTWSTNVMPLIQCGLVPVPIDVELESLNVSPRTLQMAIKTRPLKALFLTNLLGFSDEIDKIRRICTLRKIIFLEDNCEALGTVYRGRKLGNFGLASTYSFFVGHHMPTIEGGVVATDDRKLAQMVRIVRAHGWDRNLSPREQIILRRGVKVDEFYGLYTFYDLGYNLRPTEIQGFLGNQQLRYVPAIVRKRAENFQRLARAIYARTDLYYPIRFDHIDIVSNFSFPVICRSEKIKTELIRRCLGKIEVRPIVGGDMTAQPFFRKYVSKQGLGKKSNARLIHRQGLYFGNNPELTKREIKEIIHVFTCR